MSTGWIIVSSFLLEFLALYQLLIAAFLWRGSNVRILCWRNPRAFTSTFLARSGQLKLITCCMVQRHVMDNKGLDPGNRIGRLSSLFSQCAAYLPHPSLAPLTLIGVLISPPRVSFLVLVVESEFNWSLANECLLFLQLIWKPCIRCWKAHGFFQSFGLDIIISEYL